MDTIDSALRKVEREHMAWGFRPGKAVATKERTPKGRIKMKVAVYFKGTDWVLVKFPSERSATAFMTTLSLLYGTKPIKKDKTCHQSSQP